MLGKFLATDVERIESIGSVGAMFEKILLRFGILLIAFVLAESEAATIDLCCLDGKDEIVVVLAV